MFNVANLKIINDSDVSEKYNIHYIIHQTIRSSVIDI